MSWHCMSRRDVVAGAAAVDKRPSDERPSCSNNLVSRPSGIQCHARNVTVECTCMYAYCTYNNNDERCTMPCHCAVTMYNVIIIDIKLNTMS